MEELTRILDEDGYLADAERLDDGSWRIVEHNCAILGVAARYGQACSSELEFLRHEFTGRFYYPLNTTGPAVPGA